MPEKLQAIRDGLWMVVNGGWHGRQARGSPGDGRVGQDRHRAGDLERRARERRAAARTSATTAGSSSSRRATIRRSPASSSSSTAFTGRTRPRMRPPHPGRLFAEAGWTAAAAAADRTTICGWTTRIPMAQHGNRSGRLARGVHRTAPLLPSRLGCCSPAVLTIVAMGITMIYSATQATTPQAVARRRSTRIAARPRRDGRSRCRSTTARWPTSRTGSTR